MKILKTDDQTLSDLNIFGRAGKTSVFDMYNKTTTQGGSKLLEKLFKQPLSDASEINRRTEMFAVFSKGNFLFPIDSTTIATIAFYMENEDVRSQLQVSNEGIGHRLKQLVAADAEFLFVHDGVSAAIRLYQGLKQFLDEVKDLIKGSPYGEKYDALIDLLNQEPLAELKMYTAKKEVKLSDVVLAGLDKKIRFEFRESFLGLLDRLYELDVYIAIGQVANHRGFSFPRALSDDSKPINYKKLYHPHVENAIPNDLHLDHLHNILFLTGANMAGKSTLMKSLGIALYVAHMGFPVAAEELEFSVRDGIYTSINLADNLSAGASHYYAEVLRVKEVARELSAGSRLFVIFDELFRGTNVKDAFDATLALTRAFSLKSNSYFIISTHIMEAGEVLEEEKLGINFQYLPTELVGSVPVYTRILRNGITADRQGMIIIQNEGILEMLDNGINKLKKG